MRALHAIHNFLPRHRAGSEIYCLQLCQALQEGGVGTHVLCAEYDPALPHGHLRWYAVDGVGVTAVVNNWAFSSFAESYAPPALEERFAQVLDMLQPDVLHVHNLLNLSFGLPALARRRGIPVVATLHDYTLVCAAGGQRVHVAEEHVCTTIDPERCARCFPQHPLASQLGLGRIALRRVGGRRLGALAAALRRRLPRAAATLARAAAGPTAGTLAPAAIEDRLAAARAVFADVDLFVAPSRALADEYRRLGLPDGRLRVSDYGFPPLPGLPGPPRRRGAAEPLRIGFAGTLVWHKGAHVLLAAAKLLPPGGWELVLFGDTTTFPDYSARLRRDAEGLPVRFAGPFDHSLAGGAFAEVDVLVVPSLWPENSPLVIHEAFQAGVPVVGSRLGGTAELVEDGRSGLLYEATSPAALAAALGRLLAEPELQTRLAAGVPQVKPISQDAAEWSAVYASLVRRDTVTNPAGDAEALTRPAGAADLPGAGAA
jgi:glycosyltransferase involved in cell wall biosynthesis